MLPKVELSAQNVLNASCEPDERNREKMRVPADCDDDALAPARGIAWGVALGTAMWFGIGLSLWFLL